jgi:hypothetical protein
MAQLSEKPGQAVVAAADRAHVVLGPPPLTNFDDPTAYAALEAALRAEVKPQGVVEELRLRDVATLLWDARRFRRARATVLALGRQEAIANLLAGGSLRHVALGYPQDALRATASAYLDGDAKATAAVDAALRRFGLDESAIEGLALQAVLDDIERFDRLIFQADQRRDAGLRELQRSRDARAQALAEAAEAIDAEFET